ncbi:hybrid sensor histidine kinase/response regulator transcription factor [Siphonobacter sp. SORGH_AS_1065]|uniref:hybrid sensor histidine kinase/response regulator transcription factor n=1 Tax=Siphonobacter sp. SORGH_AS_1065 TaxID=3041795 RepID=UPI0027884530|nr:hybrid sensor histidine kinase/response regulator transcription factor [Siphonobacter sp. SORGH_AS_1065]MDQ1086657.1 signal transduction histidine kinase/ligand-binding sensor domain-containing protein/DNA-binding response OmpR family regulator [Siphonobacter sp. SORGH_AS_1065]
MLSLTRSIWAFTHCLLAVLLVLSTQTSFAQREPTQLRFDHLTVNEGLSHSDALCLAQDHQGFIWIGTHKGIDRYDGYQLKTYHLPVSNGSGVINNRIRALHVDHQGTLWVGIDGAGLFYYNASRDRFESILQRSVAANYQPLIQKIALADVPSLTSDHKGRLWIGTSQSGLFMLQFDSQGVVNYVSHLKLKPADVIQPFIDELTVDGSNHLWIGTLGSGLYVLNPQNQQTKAQFVPLMGEVNIRALHADRQGNLWVGTDGQIYWGNCRNVPQPASICFQSLGRGFAEIEHLYRDFSQRLWISTKSGLLLWNVKTPSPQLPIQQEDIQRFLSSDTDPFSINSIRVHDILEDSFHNIWMASSAGGLNILKPYTKPFGLIRRQNEGSANPATNYINAICKDESRNRLWIGTQNGLASYDLNTKSYTNFLVHAYYGSVNSVDVSALHLTSQGTLWIGTRYAGLFKLDLRTNTIQPVAGIPGTADWYSLSIESITEDTYGFIWISTFTGGLYRMEANGTHGVTYSLQNKLPTNDFTQLYYDGKHSILWASTRNAGLLKLAVTPHSIRLIKQFKHEPDNPNSLSTNYTWPLVQDNQGRLWIGTIGGGLHSLTQTPSGEDRIERWKKWLPETDIESLLIDESGNLWIGGSGIYQLNPRTKKFLHYDVTDGLQSNSFKIGAAYRANDHTLFMGGTNGITYFQPQAIQVNPSLPRVQITELRIHNRPVAVGDTLNGRVLITSPLANQSSIELRSTENDFSIEFVGLHYANPRKQQYAYQLVGYNKDWVRVNAQQRTVTFSNLPAGDYTFQVKSSNDDGVWLEQPTVLYITILPPWWKTWWAYLLYLTAAGIAFWLYHHNSVVQQRLKNELALKQYKIEKDQELTDGKLQFFTNVSHELRTPLTLILGPVEELVGMSHEPIHQVKDKIMLMHQQTRKLLDLVNQLLDFRKVETGSVQLKITPTNIIPFLTEIFLVFKLKAEALQLNYTIDVPPQDITLYVDRVKLESIVVNLLSNAFKYSSEGGAVEIVVNTVGEPNQAALYKDQHLLDHYLEITIKDQGVGMNEAEINRIFDPYFQATQSESIKVTGTGIGLSLVKKYVDAHQGEVLVNSQPGMGTTFILRLPFGKEHISPDLRCQIPATTQPTLEEVKQSVRLAHAEQHTPEADLTEAAHLLIVEDNEALRNYLYDSLAKTYRVSTAVDGVDGWEKTLELLPDIVISDVMMPRSSGLDLCQQIKKHPKTLHIPVFLLTARATAMHQLEGLETGADEYMTKPFNVDLLQAKVTVMLRNRFLLREYYHRQLLLKPTDLIIPSEHKSLLEKATTTIEANLTDPDFTIPILVRELGMSQSSFYRQIKTITGKTAVEFVRDVRLKKAAQLLLMDNVRIGEVMMQVGFESPKYFRKAFHQIYGMSPLEYAKHHRSNVLNEDFQDS